MPLDIFSKKKTQPERKSKIVVDFREKSSLVPSELISLGCDVEFKQLPMGDYIAGGYIIERKTLADLQASIVGKRIFSQVRTLKSQSNPLIIVEGKSGYNLHPNSFRGIILSIVGEKIPVIFSKDPQDTAKYILLASQKRSKSQFSFRPYKKTDSKEDIASYILEGIPGIGPTTARKLLEEFGSIKNVLLAPDSELKDILGSKYDSFKNAIE